MRVRVGRFAKRRRGLSLALVAVMMPAFIGFAGLCVDIGVVALSRCQLQSVADAAALAGAKQLNDPQRVSATFNLSADMTAARQRAIAIAQANLILGKPGVVIDNPNNDPGGDVVLGYKDTTVKHSPLVVSPASTSLINTVQVTARRDASHTALVPAFFSKALGFADTSVSVVSSASVQNYAVKGYRTAPAGKTTKLVPIALSLTTWNAMLAGQTTDTYTYTGKKVTTAPDGIYESSAYPVGSGSGNLGTVNFTASSNSTSYLSSQIANGVTTSDLAASGAASMGYYVLNPTIQVAGNPGVSLGIKPAMQSLIGKVVVLPIYDPSLSSGNGANFLYTLVGFAPVVVLNTSFNGIHSTLIVQPATTTDTLAVAGSTQPWTSGGLVRLRLTQ